MVARGLAYRRLWGRLLWIGIWCIAGMTTTAFAQVDSVVLTKNFKFEEGIYLTYDDFRSNRPALSLDQVELKTHTNVQNGMTKLFYLNTQVDSFSSVKADSIWGLCLKGIPYIRVRNRTKQDNYTSLASIRLRGKICYFEYEQFTVERLEMPVYNPLNGRPYQRGFVDRSQRIIKEQMMDFDSGTTADLNLDNLRRWISDDMGLLKSVMLLNNETATSEKLFKCLLIYADRNEVKVPQHP